MFSLYTCSITKRLIKTRTIHKTTLVNITRSTLTKSCISIFNNLIYIISWMFE
nr:MAG TPA: hypothetical protein [Caudoviricetes sp.]